MNQEKIFEKLNDDCGVYFTGALVEKRQTLFQALEIYETPQFGRLLRLDGCNMTSEHDEFFYHENLVHPALSAHPQPLAALVIGGGDGGSCEEILKHSTIEQVHLVELDADVIEVAKQYFANVHRDVFANPKLKVTIGDGAAYLRGAARKYDFIALDLTDPAGLATHLYTADFFRICLHALNPEGILSVHIGSPIAHPQRVSASMKNLRDVFPLVRPYFVYIPTYGSVWGFACASATLDVCAPTAQQIDERLKMRGVTARQYYNGAIHHALFALPEYVKSLVE